MRIFRHVRERKDVFALSTISKLSLSFLFRLCHNFPPLFPNDAFRNAHFSRVRAFRQGNPPFYFVVCYYAQYRMRSAILRNHLNMALWLCPEITNSVINRPTRARYEFLYSFLVVTLGCHISISSSTKNELKMSSGQLLPRVAVQVKINRVQVQRFNVISSRKINRLQLARAFILELYYSAVVELSSGIISHEKPQPRTIRTKSSAYAFSVLILTVSGTFMPPPTRHLPFGSLHGLPVTTL